MEIIYPSNLTAEINSLVERLDFHRHSLEPFSEDVILFLDSLSKELFAASRSYPSLAPLAFFIRRANSRALSKDFNNRLPEGTLAVPQGVVFHIPPTNVDSLFLYSLALSLLSGNANIVRISRNAGQETYFLLNLVTKVLSNHLRVSNYVTFVTFDRNQLLLDRLSSICDVRMVWGGDNTVNSIRKSPLGISGKELSFPDRVSLTVIDCENWLTISATEKTTFVANLYNDTYWFDQMACSSPQQLVFISEDKLLANAVEKDLCNLLDIYSREKFVDIEGLAINKMVSIVAAFELGANDATWKSNALVTVDDIDLRIAQKIRPGGGYFSTQKVASLREISNQFSRKIQTLSYIGFSKEVLKDFAKELNGRGIDRIVPVGQSLNFHEIWDGKDLLMELHRLVTVI